MEPRDVNARRLNSSKIAPTHQASLASVVSPEASGVFPASEVCITTPKARHYWKPLILLLVFWASGVAFSIGHVVYYKKQDGAIVGSPWDQENKIRVGTTLAFLSQISLGAAVWGVCTQMVWLSNLVTPTSEDRSPGPPLTMATLNKIFSADRSIWWLLSIAMLRTFTAGYIIALFGWMLILPGFFTPGTLFVYEDVVSESHSLYVPYLTIANGSRGHNYSYSPDYYGDLPENRTNVTKDFNGPRTIVTLLTTAASAGQMLAIKPPANVSSYTINFYGPTVRYSDADRETISSINSILEGQMTDNVRGAKRDKIPHYAFVASYDGQGKMTPLDTVRYQSPSNATNEIWLTFDRYNLSAPGCESHKSHLVCGLFNSTYDLDLRWYHGFQNITGKATPLSQDPVPYPMDKFPAVSDMAQHAYSAFFWALADQVTGSFVWYKEISSENISRPTRHFGGIQSPVQHNVLLGSSDLNVFFDLNEKPGDCRVDETALSPQRQQDIKLARGRILAELIEEMSFNMTVSLLHNNLLTRRVERDVMIWDTVNRYGYSRLGLLIPYGLACGLTTCAAIIGLALMLHFGPMPDRDVQDVLAATEPETLRIAREPDVHHHSFRFRLHDSGGHRHPSIFVEPNATREAPPGGVKREQRGA